MSIIKANIPGDEWINAKAGENVIEKLGYERLSWIRVVTEGPVPARLCLVVDDLNGEIDGAGVSSGGGLSVDG